MRTGTTIGVRLVGDHGGAVIDLHQAAGDGDAAFREDDQRIAGLDRVDQRARRHRLERIERHRVGELQERLHPPALRDADVDGEDRLAVAQRQREAGVEEAHVVERDDDVRPGIVEVLEPFDLDPEERAVDDRQRIAERVGRHGAADRDRDAARLPDADQHEQRRRGQPRHLQESDDHERAAAMKAALSTLTPAITRARRSAPAQACTAAKTGTMNRPPAIARPARSIAMRRCRALTRNDRR